MLKPFIYKDFENILKILVILIALVLIFKNQITTIITNAFNSINNDSNAILN